MFSYNILSIRLLMMSGIRLVSRFSITSRSVLDILCVDFLFCKREFGVTYDVCNFDGAWSAGVIIRGNQRDVMQ